MQRKSHLVVILLTVFFGPLGLFYTGGMDALIGVIFGLITAFVVPILLPVFWIGVVIAGVNQVNKHNRQAGIATPA